jgi:hypothetical protein
LGTVNVQLNAPNPLEVWEHIVPDPLGDQVTVTSEPPANPLPEIVGVLPT